MTTPLKANRGGRPRVTDRTAIASVGLRLFAEHGYDAVTTADIAEACGIGRSTLLRYFPSKADILWDRSEDEVSALTGRLQAASNGEDAISVLCRELPAMLTYLDSELDLLRTQVTIIAASSSGWPLASTRFAPWQSVVSSFIAARTGHGPEDLYTRLLTQSLFDAGWTALTMWAASDEERPQRLLDEAFSLIRDGFKEEPRPAPR